MISQPMEVQAAPNADQDRHQTDQDLSRVSVLIPAYKPDETTIKLVQSLLQDQYGEILVIDDGSGEEFRHIFDAIEQMHDVRVLRHAVNLGKGTALKSGLNDLAVRHPYFAGVITADADGQHLPEDIRKVACALFEHPKKLILGTRAFEDSVPLRSRLGNTATKYVYRFFTPTKLNDTQTGLRGIPTSLIPDVLQISGDRYEFEMRMLIDLRVQGVEFHQCDIQTVYEPGNPTSHFRAFTDSMRIYSVFTRFLATSFATFMIDVLMFSIMIRISDNIALSMAIARLVAGIYQFHACRVFVFKSSRPVATSALWYATLVLLSGFVSYGLMTAGALVWETNLVLLKVISETLLLIANFSIQRLLIFPQTTQRKSIAS